MRVATPILPNGMANAHLGRAKKIAIATVDNGHIIDWHEIDVPFENNHHHDHHNHDHHDHDHHNDDHHNHDHHHNEDFHQAMKDFMLEQNVDYLLLEHIGQGFQRAFSGSKIKLVTVDIQGKAKEVVQRFVDAL